MFVWYGSSCKPMERPRARDVAARYLAATGRTGKAITVEVESGQVRVAGARGVKMYVDGRVGWMGVWAVVGLGVGADLGLGCDHGPVDMCVDVRGQERWGGGSCAHGWPTAAWSGLSGGWARGNASTWLVCAPLQEPPFFTCNFVGWDSAAVTSIPDVYADKVRAMSLGAAADNGAAATSSK
eukprot:XP_001694169.1 predicted protein [Chlamydomonas reinhardtii]